MGRKAGDNNQLLALAEKLPWPFQCKQMHYRSFEIITNLLLGVTLGAVLILRGSTSTADALAAALLTGMEGVEEMLRSSGHYGPRVTVPDDADSATRLIGFIGRDPDWQPEH